MCIFCKSDAIETYSDGKIIIECENCKGKIEKRDDRIFVLRHPKGYKHLWIIALNIPFWFLYSGFLLLIKKAFNVTIPVFLLYIGFIPTPLSLCKLGIQNIYNYFVNDYMIFKWDVTTSNSKKYKIVIELFFSVFLLVTGALITFFILFAIIKQ